MYYLLTGIIAVSILRYFNLIPKMTSKFWTYLDYAMVIVAFVLLLSRIPPFFAGIFTEFSRNCGKLERVTGAS